MKTKLFLTFFFLSIVASAQSPVNSYYGTDNAYYAVVESTVPIDQTASGINAVWNFNSLTQIGSSIDNNAVPATAEITSYPGTTAALMISSSINGTDTSSEIFSKNVAGVVSITAVKAEGMELNYITNNAKLGAFPMNYLYTLTDATAGNYQFDTYSGTFSGSITTSVDAYGTLNMNVGPAISNVTRLKSVQTINLNYGIIPNVGTINQTTYSYYDASTGTNKPVFIYSTTHIVVGLLGIDETSETMESFLSILGTNQVGAQSNAIQLTPNPMDNILNIKRNDNQKFNSISISDISGRIVMNLNTNSNAIDVSSLTKGVYLAVINTNKGTFCQKVIKN